MGMFDSIKVKKPLPLNEELSRLDINWKEEIFQTKDLDNLLDNYEITEAGTLKHLVQEREWKEDPSSCIGGHLELTSEHWEEVPFHGIIRFYTSFCDRPNLDGNFLSYTKDMSWDEIFQTQGYDWWIEFLAIFDNGTTREIRIGKIEKSLISARLAVNKEWSLKNELRDQKLFNRIIKELRRIPGYKSLTRNLSRVEQKCHEKISAGIRKIS